MGLINEDFGASTTWTCPPGVTAIVVQCIGGGGAGSINGGSGNGGGGGGYALKEMSVVPGNSYTVTVGAGGASGFGGVFDGGDSWFSSTSIVKGSGGLKGDSGGTGGSGVGDIVNAGGTGVVGHGAGGSGGPTGAGSNGSGASGGAGAGFNSQTGNGGGTNAGGSLYGGGGGGANSVFGGSGANGIVRIAYYGDQYPSGSNTTWTPPVGVSTAVVRMWGAGGGGAAGAVANNTPYFDGGGGGGGGGGAYIKATLTGLTPTHTYTVIASYGGTHGIASGAPSPGTSGSAGGYAKMIRSGNFIIAYGGNGGIHGSYVDNGPYVRATVYGGAGGTGGGYSSAGLTVNIAANGGFANAGGDLTGYPSSGQPWEAGGNGGAGAYGGAGGAGHAVATGPGDAGIYPGGGGGGGNGGYNYSNNGGDGAGGRILITYTPQYLCPAAMFASMV